MSGISPAPGDPAPMRRITPQMDQQRDVRTQAPRRGRSKNPGGVLGLVCLVVVAMAVIEWVKMALTFHIAQVAIRAVVSGGTHGSVDGWKAVYHVVVPALWVAAALLFARRMNRLSWPVPLVTALFSCVIAYGLDRWVLTGVYDSLTSRAIQGIVDLGVPGSTLAYAFDHPWPSPVWFPVCLPVIAVISVVVLALLAVMRLAMKSASAQ